VNSIRQFYGTADNAIGLYAIRQHGPRPAVRPKVARGLKARTRPPLRMRTWLRCALVGPPVTKTATVRGSGLRLVYRGPGSRIARKEMRGAGRDDP